MGFYPYTGWAQHAHSEKRGEEKSTNVFFHYNFTKSSLTGYINLKYSCTPMTFPMVTANCISQKTWQFYSITVKQGIFGEGNKPSCGGGEKPPNVSANECTKSKCRCCKTFGENKCQVATRTTATLCSLISALLSYHSQVYNAILLSLHTPYTV